MKYVSIDIETTGIDAKQDQILMASFVVEDTENIKPLRELPHFTFFLRHARYAGNAYALSLNSWILKALSDPYKTEINGHPIINDGAYQWSYEVEGFIHQHFGESKAVAAGKNVAGFDLPFFPESIQNLFIHRVIDPGSVFIDWDQNKPYSLPQIKGAMGMEDTVTHDAYDDAIDVIRVLRTQYT